MKTRLNKLAKFGGLMAALVIIQLCLASGAPAQKYENYLVDGEKLSDQEKYVLERTEKGYEADLLEKFVLPRIPEPDRQRQVRELGLTGYLEKLGDEKKDEEKEKFLKNYGNRLRLRAQFLETLLIEGFPGFKIHRHGVRIDNAIINESLDFKGAEVDHVFWLWQCRLQGNVDFKDSSFQKNLLLSGSQFLGEVNFDRIEVGKVIFLEYSKFHGPVIFSAACIGVNFQADGAKFLNEKKEANFNSMKVGVSAFFNNAEFKGPVDFGSADIKGNFEAQKSKFLNQNQSANFNSIKVGHSTHFEKAEFKGPVNFVSADIKGNFEAEGAKFLNQDQTADFNSMKVGHTAHFEEAEFQGPVNFGSAEIKSNFEAGSAKFLTYKFSAIVSIPVPLPMLNFLYKDQTSYFDSMKIGKMASFEEAEFQGPVNFVSAKIDGDFGADGAKFLNEGNNTFESIKIGHYALFRNAVFKGSNDFSYGNFLDLTIRGNEADASDNPAKKEDLISLWLEGALVNRNLTITNIKIGELKASNCQVMGTAAFDQVKMPGKDRVHIKGLSCQSMSMSDYSITTWWDNITNKLPQWLYPRDPLLGWVDNSDCDSRTYLNLEAFFQRMGNKDLADQTYIKMKQKESGLNTWNSWLKPWNWPKLIFWDLPVGYGRKPLRILVFALIFIGIGVCFFNPKYLTREKWPRKNKFYALLGRVLLSCDICTPSLLNLGMEKDWSPPRISGKMKCFIFLYGLLGRIFIAVFFLGVWEKFK